MRLASQYQFSFLKSGTYRNQRVGSTDECNTSDLVLIGGGHETRSESAAVVVADCAVPGHWEGDLLAGGRSSQIATLVERQSRFVQLVKVRHKDAATVLRALTRHARALPDGLMASLTWDRGPEMAHHKRFTVATDIAVYFCDPHSPWQRGTNENTNGLLRQYFPRGTDLSNVSQAKLNAVALQLNTRPRKTLGFKTPAEKLASTVATTG